MSAALGGGFGLFLVRAAAVAVGLFGALGFALALVGVYGVMAWLAGQRRHELGVRMALGAAPFDIARLLLRDGTILVMAGLVAGIAIAVAASYAFRTVLFGVAVLDAVAFGVAAPLVGGAAVIGCAIPAWRAGRVDPMTTLRLE
jgi:ABC-type antimicrobial peptide transport system permease subunit